MSDYQNPAKLGTVTRVYGVACDNLLCTMRQGLVFGGRYCELCGCELKPASVAVACLRWEDGRQEGLPPVDA